MGSFVFFLGKPIEKDEFLIVFGFCLNGQFGEVF